jgi:ribosomal protein S18 acetylase RimI-like enzyme
MMKPRGWENEQDLQEILAFLMDARSLTGDWRYPHIGEFLWNYFMIACHLDPCRHIRLWRDGRGRLVAYATLGEDPAFDIQVHPTYEWDGIEDGALAWAENLLVELRSSDAALWGGALVSGSRQDNPQRIAFLEQHGFHQGGEFSEVNLMRSLRDPIPEPAIPAGFLVRAVTADAPEISRRAAAQREVWRPWTVGNVSDADYARFMHLPGYHRELDIAAVTPDGSIAAYANGWLDPLNHIGDFGPVGALPAFRRMGLTRAVLFEGLRRMKNHGMQRVCVSTGVSNTPAIRLYESVGFTIVNKYLEYVRVE